MNRHIPLLREVAPDQVDKTDRFPKFDRLRIDVPAVRLPLADHRDADHQDEVERAEAGCDGGIRR